MKTITSYSLPLELAEALLWLPDEARTMGIRIVAPRGAGKSRLMGRILAWSDFVRGFPVVLIDPIGSCIDNFIDKFCRLPVETQKRHAGRILYVDMAASDGYVVPFPLYYRRGGESLYQISQRYLDAVHLIDPDLSSAAVEGWNAFKRIGTYTGMILAALDLQISEAYDLLINPQDWAERFQEAIARNPDAAPAASFFENQYSQWDNRFRLSRTDSFLNKLLDFQLDSATQAIFGASQPGIAWQNVCDSAQAVLIDFRHVETSQIPFKMLWVYLYFLDFIKSRGYGQHTPISLIIDEITYLLAITSRGQSLFAAALDELLNRIMRSHRLWVTLCHQETFQLDRSTQKTLLAMGTQIIGGTTDPDAARMLATRFFLYQPDWVKKEEPVYGTVDWHKTGVIDYRSVEYTIDEQREINSRHFTDTMPYHFYVSPVRSEGEVTSRITSVNIGAIDKGIYPEDAFLKKARGVLAKRSGRGIDEVLKEIQDRRAEHSARSSRETSRSGKKPLSPAPSTQFWRE